MRLLPNFMRKKSLKDNKSNPDVVTEVKNYIDYALENLGAFGVQNNFEISIANAFNLYQECAPFFMVVDKIVGSYSEIPFRLFDKRNDKFIDDHPVLELLDNPNPESVEYNFKERLASLFLITGNSFLMATGRVNAPPLELYTLSPLYMTAVTADRNYFGFVPTRWQYNSNIETINFNADETASGVRYYNDDIRELYHLKRFNPINNQQSFFGMSKAYPLFREMESYTAGNINNASLLKNGARPSMAWVNNRGEELTEAQYERIVQEARKFSGADNAGATPILDGMDIKDIGQSNRDMQFKELQDTMLARIANVFGVPLALLLDSTMTLNNLQTARLHLDKDAVIPLAKRINEELTRFLLPRYEGSENLEFALDVSEIESLKPEVLTNAELMKQIGVNTINEIRTEMGYEPIEGGDVLPPSGNPMAPVMGATEDAENADQEVDDEVEAEDEDKSYQVFAEHMKAENLPDDEIKALWLLSKSK